jgi:AcrR family transcriptional regulator
LAERILRAVATVIAERGYGAATIGEFAARARISQSTFYTHFESKEDAAMAALDAALAQMLAAVQPAARRAPDWPHGARAAMGALCSFGAAEPAFAGLAIVEVYAMGKAALEARDRAVWPLGRLIDPALERLSLPVRRPILLEVLAGAIYTLAYDQVRGEGPQSLPQIAPLATYMLLAPFLGAEEACEVANSDGRRRA